jgi:hypothetical protein
MCEIPWQNPFEQLIHTENTKGQECKTVPVQGWVLVRRGAGMERMKEDKHGYYTSYTCRNNEVC